MSNQLQSVRLTQELFDQFQSLYHFSVNEVNPEFNQGLFDMSTYSYIFLVDSKPIAAFGVIMLWQGVGECWMMGSPELSKHAFAVIKKLRSLTDQLITAGLHRVQIYVADTTNLNKWAQLLGFTFEGRLHRHSADGSDNMLYAKWLPQQ
jgi:hypothetical protein